MAFGSGSTLVFAQDGGDSIATPDAQTDTTEVPATEETVVTTEEPAVTPEETVPDDVQTPPDSVDPTQPVDTPAPTDEPTATDEPTTTPELVSTLNYVIAEPITCTPATGEAVAADGTVDYDCTFAVDLHGKNLLPEQIALAWTASVSTESNWPLRLAAPAVNDGTWTDPGQQAIQLGADQSSLDALSITPPVGDGQDAFIDGRITIAFRVQLERPPCAVDPATFQVSAGATASAPGNPQATVAFDSAQPDPLTIAPALAPLAAAAPVVSIESVTIEPVAFSFDDRTTQGVLTIHVENGEMQCAASVVSVAIQAFVGTDISNSTSIVSTGTLAGAPEGGYTLIDPGTGTALDANVAVSTIEVGATPGSYTQTITFAVTVPGQISAGSFDVQASAAVETGTP